MYVHASPRCSLGLVLLLIAPIDGSGLSQTARAQTAGFSVRHEVEVPMPTRLRVQRTESRISISYDLASLRKVKVIVDAGKFIGIKDEMRAYAKSDVRPRSAGRVSYTSIEDQPTSSFLRSETFLNKVPDGIPTPGMSYVIERDISLFETDVPPQHMWDGIIGDRYRVLWERTLNAESR
jgi:hypothetical protein